MKRKYESEKAGNRIQDSWLVQPVLCWTTTSICAAEVILKCLSHTPGSHSACAVRSPLGTPLQVDWEILSTRREPTLTLNKVPTVHTEWLPGVWLRHFSTTCTVHIKDCGVGGCLVAIAQWQNTGSTSELCWVQFLATAGLFTFLSLSRSFNSHD